MTRQTWLERNWLLVVVAIAVLLFVVLPLIWQFWLAPTVFEQNRQSGQEIAEDSLKSDAALENYRWFRSQWHDIQSQKEQLDHYQDQLKSFYEIQGKNPDDWSRAAETRHGRIQDRITGTRNQISRLVEEYNARSDDATRSLFQCGLPYNVNEKLFIADGTGVEYTSQEAMNRTPPEDPTECKYSEAPDE